MLQFSELSQRNKGLSHSRIQEFSSGGGGGGVQVSLTKKSSDVFCLFFLVLSLFYRSQMVNFKEIYHFSRFRRGFNIFQGGKFSQGGGGVQLLIPNRNPYNLWFSRGVRTPCPPLWIRTCKFSQFDAFTNAFTFSHLNGVASRGFLEPH